MLHHQFLLVVYQKEKKKLLASYIYGPLPLIMFLARIPHIEILLYSIRLLHLMCTESHTEERSRVHTYDSWETHTYSIILQNPLAAFLANKHTEERFRVHALIYVFLRTGGIRKRGGRVNWAVCYLASWPESILMVSPHVARWSFTIRTDHHMHFISTIAYNAHTSMHCAYPCQPFVYFS